MDKIKILYLYSSKGFAGIPRNLSLLTGSINPQRFDCSVALVASPEEEQADFRGRGGSREQLRSFHRIDSPAKIDFGVFKQIKTLAEEMNIDILSCHGYKADFYGALFKLLYKPKFKLTSITHGWVAESLKIRFYHLIDILALWFFDRVVLVEESQQRCLPHINPARLEVINNAVDYEAFSSSSACEPTRAELGLVEGEQVIGFSGRLSPEKGLRCALEAFSRVSKKHPNVRFLIIGDGPEREELEGLANKLGVSERVIFAGYRKNMRALYSLFDIYLSCSKKEGLPNSVLEAMSAGIPCVLSKIPGHTVLGEEGVQALFAQPKAARQFASQIERLLGDKELRQELKDESRKMIRKKFSISKRAEAFEKFYQSLVS